MEEAYDIFNYLPISYKSESEEKYIAFLWDSFRINYEAEKYPFAFIAFNMLYMSFVYFEVWQIKQSKYEEFKMAMVGFHQGDEESDLINASSPFTFSAIGESRFFRFLKLINCENDQIGTFSSIISTRNKSAHSNGVISFTSQTAIDNKISEVLGNVQKIQTLSKPIVRNCFIDFLKNSWNPEEREYFDDEEQIREELVHKHYLSQKDINLLRSNFRVSTLSDELNYKEIQNLFYKFREIYKSDV